MKDEVHHFTMDIIMIIYFLQNCDTQAHVFYPFFILQGKIIRDKLKKHVITSSNLIPYCYQKNYAKI